MGDQLNRFKWLCVCVGFCVFPNLSIKRVSHSRIPEGRQRGVLWVKVVSMATSELRSSFSAVAVSPLPAVMLSTRRS